MGEFGFNQSVDRINFLPRSQGMPPPHITFKLNEQSDVSGRGEDSALGRVDEHGTTPVGLEEGTDRHPLIDHGSSASALVPCER